MAFAGIMDVCALPGAMVWTCSPYELGQGTQCFPRKLRFEKGKMYGIAFLLWGSLTTRCTMEAQGSRLCGTPKHKLLKDHTEEI